MLNDSTIRGALKTFLQSKSNKPKMVIEELRIHNGNSIADLVGVYGSLHGFEIKGETDKVTRIERQAVYYDRSFPTVTLVTTDNHLAWAQENLPSYWGIILALATEKGVKFSYVKGAKPNPHFSRETSLLMLWRDELLEVATSIGGIKLLRGDSRATIAKKISARLGKKATAKILSSVIYERFYRIDRVKVM